MLKALIKEKNPALPHNKPTPGQQFTGAQYTNSHIKMNLNNGDRLRIMNQLNNKSTTTITPQILTIGNIANVINTHHTFDPDPSIFPPKAHQSP